MNKKGISKKIIILVLLISVLVIVAVLLAFGILNKSDNEVEEKYNPGVITMSYTDSNIYKFDNLIPLTDSLGKTSNDTSSYFDFIVDTKIEDSDEIEYEISVTVLEDESNVTLDMIKMYLEVQKSGSFSKVFGPEVFSPIAKKSTLGTPEGYMILLHDSKKTNSSDNYRLRVWLDENYVVADNSVYYASIKVNVYGNDK